MTATTYTQVPGRKSGSSFGGWLVRIFERVVEAQQRRIRKQVHDQLRSFSDETLKEIGYSAAAIRKLRNGEWVGYPA